MSKTFVDSNGDTRCNWCEATPEYIAYHDQEWGFPINDDKQLFEKLCLESFQSGLSWRTILVKRENFRKAFHQFDFNLIANFTEHDVARLLQDEGIVRHRGKIEATINNAKRAQELIEQEGSLAAFFWSYESKSTNSKLPVRSTSDESIALSKALKKKGWKFIGPTTAYAFLQAIGVVNDHYKGCIFRNKVKQAKAKFKRPT